MTEQITNRRAEDKNVQVLAAGRAAEILDSDIMDEERP